MSFSIRRFTSYSFTCFNLSLLAALSASAAGSWSNQPSWAAGNESAAPRRTILSPAKELNTNISPFAPGSNNFALDVGQVFLMGDLSSKYADSIGMQAHYTYGVSEMFGFDASAGYSSHSDGSYSMTTLLTGLRTNLAWYDRVIPYAVFGLGFYKPSFKMDGSDSGFETTSISPLLFGLHMGPGVDLEITKQLFFGASLTFHDMFGSQKTTPSGRPLDVGGTYTSFFVHAGFTF